MLSQRDAGLGTQAPASAASQNPQANGSLPEPPLTAAFAPTVTGSPTSPPSIQTALSRDGDATGEQVRKSQVELDLLRCQRLALMARVQAIAGDDALQQTMLEFKRDFSSDPRPSPPDAENDNYPGPASPEEPLGEAAEAELLAKRESAAVQREQQLVQWLATRFPAAVLPQGADAVSRPGTGGGVLPATDYVHIIDTLGGSRRQASDTPGSASRLSGDSYFVQKDGSSQQQTSRVGLWGWLTGADKVQHRY